MLDLPSPLKRWFSPLRIGAAAAFGSQYCPVHLTPREVGRRHPRLSRRLLVKRRALGLPPRHEVVSGCIMYVEAEIERFVAEPADASDLGAVL
jgi:hypothetical protein